MLGLATTDLCTKFEISTLPHYKDIKGDENAKIGVVWGIRGHPRSSESVCQLCLSLAVYFLCVLFICLYMYVCLFLSLPRMVNKDEYMACFISHLQLKWREQKITVGPQKFFPALCAVICSPPVSIYFLHPRAEMGFCCNAEAHLWLCLTINFIHYGIITNNE